MVVSSLTSSKYEISVKITQIVHIRPKQKTFAEAKRIYWCVYNDTSD